MIPSLGQFVLTSDTLIHVVIQEPVLTLLIAAPSVLGLFGGTWVISVGRRMRAIPAETPVKEGDHPPILFLRSFDDDDLVDPTPGMIPIGDFFPDATKNLSPTPSNGLGRWWPSDVQAALCRASAAADCPCRIMRGRMP